MRWADRHGRSRPIGQLDEERALFRDVELPNHPAERIGQDCDMQDDGEQQIRAALAPLGRRWGQRGKQGGHPDIIGAGVPVTICHIGICAAFFYNPRSPKWMFINGF